MGERFAGRYELVDHLGEGGGGTVWRAWDARTQRYVAAKLLRQRDAATLLRFVREQSMRVAHPHVIAPRGWAAEDDDVLLTMDLVAGGSVATLLADFGALPLPTVLVLVDQLLDALGAVHAAGLVHRDVKPANLLLEPTGTGTPFLRLGDFGIAVALDDPRLTETGTVIGTPGYVAPEVLRSAAPDPRADLWSVAVVARQMLTGMRPATGPTGLPLPEEQQQPLPAGVPVELRAWLSALAADDPARRPALAAEARHSLRALACWAAPRVDPAAEPVEVFDHLAELPAGWTPTGPVAGAAGPEVGAAALDRAAGTPLARTDQRRPVAPLPSPKVEGPRSPDPADGPLSTERTALLPGQEPGLPMPSVPPSPHAPHRSKGRTLQLVAAAVLAVIAVVAFVLAASAGDGAAPDGGSGESGSRAPTDLEAGDPCTFADRAQTRPGTDRKPLECDGTTWR